MRLLAVTLLAVAGTILPATSASAVCDPTYHAITGDCSPCHTLQRVIPSLICPQ